MTAIKAEPSRESILEEIEINQRIGADHRFSEKEWSVIIAVLRAPAGNAGVREGVVMRDNLREARSALAMIRETIETLGPVGAVQASEHLDGPTFMHEAEALVAGIRHTLASREAEPVNSHAALTSRVEELKKALREISELYQGGHGYRAVGIARAALQTGGGK